MPLLILIFIVVLFASANAVCTAQNGMAYAVTTTIMDAKASTIQDCQLQCQNASTPNYASVYYTYKQSSYVNLRIHIKNSLF